MADASPEILFIIGLRRAGIEDWVKYAVPHLRICPYAYPYAPVKTRLYRLHLLFAVHELLRFGGSRVKKGESVQVFVDTRVNGF